jgi:hypothetical protein
MLPCLLKHNLEVVTQINSKGSVRFAISQEGQGNSKQSRRRGVDISLTSIFVPELRAEGELPDLVFGHSTVCGTKTIVEGTCLINNLHQYIGFIMHQN